MARHMPTVIAAEKKAPPADAAHLVASKPGRLLDAATIERERSAAY
jgi:hypothetical protein